MAQLPLFEPGDGALVEDEWGRITCTPRLIPAALIAEGSAIALVSQGATRRYR